MTPLTRRTLTARIRILPESVVAKIAAGEVVERPASVLKELLENALDAGAAKIRVWAERAGRKLIRISDDGCGMAPEDLRSCVQRHATSKITSLEDLDRLKTYGFRGEALYAIASVSRMTLTSCVKGAAAGHRIELVAGKIVSEQPAPPLAGTTIEVKALFYNTPARAKFLKTDGTERAHLTRTLEECALAHPEITFGYTLEGSDIFHLAGRPIKDPATDFRTRAQAVLGKESFAPLTFHMERGDLKVLAYLAPPDSLGYTRNLQHWFVNDRPVVSRLLQQILYKAYQPYRSMSMHPSCLVFLDLPPSHYDVNVHPAKREIRFRFEREIFDTLQEAFAKKLREAKPVPSAFPTTSAASPDTAEAPAILSGNRTAGTEPASSVRESPTSYEALLSPHSPLASPLFQIQASRELAIRFLGQLEKTYLIFEDTGGLVLVDQHAAAERILYERFLDELESRSLQVQPLMLPISIETRPSETQKLEAYQEDLKSLGYTLERLGKGAFGVSSQPAAFEMDAKDLKELFELLIEELPQSPTGGREKLKDLVAHRACRKAIKAHESLSPEGALRLLSDLRQCWDGSSCPHGRPTTLAISRSELARRFQRSSPPPL